MGLTGALNIGRSALTASQVGLQLTGNNMANAATAGYSRQTLALNPAGGSSSGGVWLGRGVQIDGITRHLNESVQGRLRLGISQEAAANTRLEVYAGVEATLGELSEFDLSTQLNTFFNAWSERANLVGSDAVVVQQGQQLATFMSGLRRNLASTERAIDTELGSLVNRANSILNQIGEINGTITRSEAGTYEAGNLRDQRDNLLNELSEIMDVNVIPLEGGGVDVLVGSTPVLLGGQSRGVELVRQTNGDRVEIGVSVRDDGRRLDIGEGRIGALLETRENAVAGTIADLDTLASRLIYEVNRVYAAGASESNLSSSQTQHAFALGDQTMALNDPTNGSAMSLIDMPSNGGFLVTVRDDATGAETVTRIDVDLDGLDNAGQPGFADDTSAEDIRAQLDAIPGLSATFSSDGRLVIRAASGTSFTTSEDSSGVLASLGFNAFFTGTDAGDIAVRGDLEANPALLTVGRMIGGDFVENGTALAIAQLQGEPLDSLSGLSLTEKWATSVEEVANRAGAAVNDAEAQKLVRESLEAQRASLSGVDLDEESINLLQFQRQYQAGARLISVADEMFDTLLSII